jgi:DtxR family manganese transport transcriptional regulator
MKPRPQIPEVDIPPRRPRAEQAQGFRTTRGARQSEVAEDYVELVADLIDTKGEARLTEIAERMGVKKPTATKTLARLQQENLVFRERYKSITLTPTGRRLAEKCRRRHRLVVDFLMVLGIDETTAEQDAEGMEHHVSQRTLRAFADFIKANSD